MQTANIEFIFIYFNRKCFAMALNAAIKWRKPKSKRVLIIGNLIKLHLEREFNFRKLAKRCFWALIGCGLKNFSLFSALMCFPHEIVLLHLLNRFSFKAALNFCMNVKLVINSIYA